MPIPLRGGCFIEWLAPASSPPWSYVASFSTHWLYLGEQQIKEANMSKQIKSRHRQKGALIHIILGGILIVLVVAVWVIDGLSCSGPCPSVACTAAAPCAMDTNGDGVVDECTLGSMCTAASLGSVCETHFLFADCKCANVSRTPGQCSAKCLK